MSHEKRDGGFLGRFLFGTDSNDKESNDKNNKLEGFKEEDNQDSEQDSEPVSELELEQELNDSKEIKVEDKEESEINYSVRARAINDNKTDNKNGGEMSNSELNLIEDNGIYENNLKHMSEEEKREKEVREKAERDVEKVLLDSKIGEYVKDENVTDIGYNGTDLYIQDNKGLHKIDNSGVTSTDILTLGKMISNSVNKTFTSTKPVLDTAVGRFRLNFMHTSISPFGTTMALRVSKPKLAITDPSTLANANLIRLLNLCMKIGENTVISGETGSGKTELQKFLVGYIPDDKKITLMEDTPDSHLKAIYPQKDINSWVTKMGGDNDEGKVDFVDLLKAALRNNPEWAIISETRGAEAKNMIDVAQTDHNVITTLHASGAQLIPSRIISMVAQGSKDFNEVLLGRDITDVINIGVHMKLDRSTGKMNRFIREVVEFTGYDEKGTDYNYLYRVTNEFDEDTGEYTTVIETGPVTERFVEKLKLNRLYHLLPVYHHPDCYDKDGNFIISKAKEIYERSQKIANKDGKFEVDETINLSIKKETNTNTNNNNRKNNRVNSRNNSNSNKNNNKNKSKKRR